MSKPSVNQPKIGASSSRASSCAALVAPQPGKTRRGAQFKRLRLLSASYCEALLEVRFGHLGIGMRTRSRELASGSMDFGFIPSFIRLAHYIERLGEGVLRFSNSAACCVRAGQPREAKG